MDKNIKYLIEDIVKFNPADYSEEISDLVDTNTMDNIL